MTATVCTLALLMCGLAHSPAALVADAAAQSAPPVIEKDYEPYQRSGHGAIYGHVDVNSSSAFGPSVTVYLLPGTDYTMWWVNRKIDEANWYAQGTPMDPLGTPLSSVAARAIRKTYSDPHGQFAFVGLPSGWYVLFASAEDRPPPRTLQDGYTTTYTYYTWDEADWSYKPHADEKYHPPIIDSGEDFMQLLGSDEFRVISGAPPHEVPIKIFTTINCGAAHHDICPGTDVPSA